MPDFSLVPVDHQPDFSDVSLVPVDHDPFVFDGGPQRAQFPQAQTQIQPEQPQPQSPSQQPTTGPGQPNINPPGASGNAPGQTPDRSGSSEPAPFGGYANPTPTESLVNRAMMEDQARIAEADRTGKNGRLIDGGHLYKFVTTGESIAHYLIDGSAGTVFTAIHPFYAYDGTRTARIDASRERALTVTFRGDGTFTINRP